MWYFSILFDKHALFLQSFSFLGKACNACNSATYVLTTKSQILFGKLDPNLRFYKSNLEKCQYIRMSQFIDWSRAFAISARIVHNGCLYCTIPAYSHNQLALDNFWAAQPDLHSTISIVAWYSMLKMWNIYYILAYLLTTYPFLSLLDTTWPFDNCSNS